MADDCVYVKEAVLTQLEREKRGLRWQLSRTAKIAEARAADVSAYEAKVKDLLTIVEMNKSVADKAVKRSYTQESQLHKVTSERDLLAQQLMQQRKRFVDQSVYRLQQQRALRRKRGVFQVLKRFVARERAIRVRLTRVGTRIHRQRLQTAWHRWQRRVRIRDVDASVSPLCTARSIATATAAVTSAFLRVPSPTAAAPIDGCCFGFPTDYLYDECFRLRFKRRLERKRMSFFAWKAQWMLAKKQETMAVTWITTQRWRIVFRTWKHKVQRKLRHASILHQTRHHRIARVFQAWSTRVRRDMQRHHALHQILKRQRRKVLQQFLTRFRLQCVERCALEWTEVLKTAHVALEEEKMMYSLHQDAALKEIHASSTTQEFRQRQFTALEAQKRTEWRKHRQLAACFAAWTWQFRQRELHDQVALRFCRGQHRLRDKRRHFVALARLTRQRARVKALSAKIQMRTLRIAVRTCFQTFARYVRVEVAKRRRLCALASRLRRMYLLQSWGRWHQKILLDEHHMLLQCETHEMAATMQSQEVTFQKMQSRTDKLRRRYQLQCALLLRDAWRDCFLRRTVRNWALVVKTGRLRRNALRRLVVLRASHLVKHRLAQWKRNARHVALIRHACATRAAKRKHQQMDLVFVNWRQFTRHNVQLRWNVQRKYLYFALWRGYQDRKRARDAALKRFLYRRIVLTWQRQALHKWQRRHNRIVSTEKRRKRYENDLLTRVWGTWQRFMTHRLRSRHRQNHLLLANMETRMQSQRLHLVLTSWKWLQTQRVQRQNAIVSRTARRHLRTKRQVLSTWTKFAALTMQRRQVIGRILKRMTGQQRLLRTKWTHWVKHTVHSMSVLAVKARARQQIEKIIECMAARHIVVRTFYCWHQCVRDTLRQKQQYTRFLQRRRGLALRHCFTRWRHEFLPQQHQKKCVVRKWLLQIDKQTLRRGFQQWERVARLHAFCVHATVSQILLDRLQERSVQLMQTHRTSKALKGYFSAWSQMTKSRKARRQRIHRLLQVRFQFVQRSVWRKWTSYCELQLRFETLCYIFMRQKLLRTWRRLQSRLRHRKLRIGGCVKVLELVGRWTLRVAWHNWKRQHQLASVGVMLATKQQDASARFDNILVRLMAHRHSKHCQRHAFVQWRIFVQREMRLRRLLKHWMTTNQRIDLTRLTKQCFAAWQSVCMCQTQRMTILNRLVTRKRHSELRSALHQWRYQALKVIHHSQLQRTKQVLKRSQMANTKRVAVMMYTAWKRPCLESCFTRWRAYLQEKKRRLHTIMTQFTTTCNVRLVTSVFRMWLEYTRVKKTAALLWQSYRRDIGHKVMARVFHTWKALMLTEQRRKTLLHRLGAILCVWKLRKWFKELQLQHHEVKLHRASTTVVLSAQSALRQQKQQHVLKTIAIMLRRRQKAYLNTIFASWKLLWDAQRTMKRFMAVTQRRFERRRLHRMITYWKMFVNMRKATSRLHHKLQQMRTQRTLITVFRAWTAEAQQCHDIKTFVYHRIFTSRAHHALHTAWSTWQRFVRHTSLEGERERVMLFAIESQQQRDKVGTLTTRSESLLVETMVLKNRIQELRQRNLGLFCWRLTSVATKTELTRAFATWKDRVAKMHMLHVVLVRLGHQKQNRLFQHWRATTIARRVHDAQQQQQQSDRQVKLAKAMLSLLAPSSSECAIKWSMLLRWKAATTSQRKSRKRTQVLFTLAAKHHDKQLMHGYYAQWKARVARRKAQLSVLRLLQLRFNGNLRHEAYLKWLRWHWRLHEWRRGIQLITNVLTRRQKHDLHMRWWTWRVHCRQQQALASFNGKITVLELKNWNACCQSTLEQLMLLVFLNWKALVRTRQARRRERELVSQEFQSRYNALRRHFEAWRSLLKWYQTRIHPVLCTQMSWKTATKAARLREAPEAPRVRYCRFNEYRRRVQSTRWQCAQRQRTSKSILRRERVHLAAFTMLIQSVRRQHLRVQRHALWIWFARTQAISPTLATIPFRAMPWRLPRVQFAGSMLLMALEEMHHLQQAFVIEQKVSAFRMLLVIHRHFHKLRLRHAFHNLKSLLLTRTWQRQRGRGLTTMAVARSGRSADVAVARAMAQKLLSVLLRRSFRIWKEQYVAAALADAEAAQRELLHALRDVSSYRHTLDPYATPF